jgi:hypothetical protein
MFAAQCHRPNPEFTAQVPATAARSVTRCEKVRAASGGLKPGTLGRDSGK